MVFRILLFVLVWPFATALAQQPVMQAFNYLKVYELAMTENPAANNTLAIESLLAAKEEIDKATGEIPFSSQAATYLMQAKIYIAMLIHPTGNPQLDRSRPLTIQPAFDAIKKYETLADTFDTNALWESLLKQTFLLAFEAEEQLKERQVVERSLEGANMVAYLKSTNRPLPVPNIDASFAGLFTQILRRDVGNGNLTRAGTIIPLTKQWYPDNGELWLTYVNYYIRNDQRKEALDAARMAIPLNDDNTKPVRKQLYFTAGNLAVSDAPMEALNYFEQAAAIDSNFYGAVYNAGVIYARLGSSMAQQAQRLQENDTNKAGQLLQQKTTYFKQAVPFLEKAYALKPAAAIRENLVTIYLDLGNRPKALQWQQKRP